MAFMPTNTAADTSIASGGDLFEKIKQGESKRVRLLPPLAGTDGRTVFRQDLHYKLKDPNSDDPTKTVAVGCGCHHGDGTCFLCDVVRVLKNSSDKAEKDLTQFPNSIGASTSYYVQALIATKGPEGDVYSDPKLLGLGKSGVQNLNKLNATCQQNDIPLPNDPESGQLLIITNDQDAKEYKITQTSKLLGLDKIDPNVESKMVKDVMAKLDTKVWTREHMEAALRHTYPAIDWDAVMAEVEG